MVKKSLKIEEKVNIFKIAISLFEVKYIKNFSLEHILKNAGEVSIVDNYGKMFS
jgi:hypothetical protein